MGTTYNRIVTALKIAILAIDRVFHAFFFSSIYIILPFIKKSRLQDFHLKEKEKYFFHPDFTVATRISLVQPNEVRGVYRREGITPNPEVFLL